MKTIVFQGDSITDAGRTSCANPDESKGWGYANLIGSEIQMREPGTVVYNRGINGHRVVDLFARWKKDCINLKPDVLSILIGVNDVWHERGAQNGVEPEKFEMVYRLMLEEVIKKVPGIKIIIMGAYLTKGTVAEEGEDWQSFYDEVKIRRDIAEKLAKEYGLEYIDLQKVFDDALAIAPAEHWTAEGVHPTSAGHALIKEKWMEVYNRIK